MDLQILVGATWECISWTEHCSCNQTLTGFVNEYNRYIHSAHYSTHLINLIGFITQEIQITSKCELDWFID